MCQSLTDAAMQRLGPMPNLRTIVLRRCHLLTDAALLHLAHVAPRLAHIDISHCFRITDGGFTILSHMPELTELAARECPRLTQRGLNALARTAARLQVLDLRLCTEVTDDAVADMLLAMDAAVRATPARSSPPATTAPPTRRNSTTDVDLMPPLLALLPGELAGGAAAEPGTPLRSVTRPSSATDLSVAVLADGSGDSASNPASAPPSEAAPWSSAQSPAESPVHATGPPAPPPRLALTTLRLGFSSAVSDRSLRILATVAPNLIELDVGNCRVISNDGLMHLQGLPNLQRLNLSKCRQITDEGVAHIAQCRKLRELNLSYCDFITDASLRHLSSLPDLKVLDISRCTRLTYAGLVPLSRLSGLNILRGSA